MFLRCNRRKKDGKLHEYWSVVESRRLADGRVVQRQVLYLGEINASQREAWRKTIEVQEAGTRRQVALFPIGSMPADAVDAIGVRVNELRLQRPRQWGACWLALSLWQQLELDAFWAPRLPSSREGTPWLKVLKTLVAYRLIDPGSEWRLHRQWFDSSAMGDLLDADFALAEKNTLYRCLDKLLAHKDDLFKFLVRRWGELFGAKFDVLLYDLTSTYFESDTERDTEDLRQYGYAIEFAGEAVEALEVEERFTLCNLAVELGARFGLVAPDERTLAWVRGRPGAPTGQAFEAAANYWRKLHSDVDARFEREEVFDAREVAPMVTWGTSPQDAIAITSLIPQSAATEPEGKAALQYLGLQAGTPIAGTPVDWVFIGSCANSRLSDLRAAALVARGRRVAPGVTAWVVPGSEAVKRAAEAEGLHTVFKEAGFHWREPGCSMCVAANGEQVPPGKRCVSTSNRNFVGRQGPGARTHLASPATAAATAIAGCIADPRALG